MLEQISVDKIMRNVVFPFYIKVETFQLFVGNYEIEY